MHVTIIETKTGRVVGRYPVTLGALNYAPSEDEYVSEAWDAAVEDKAVDANDRTKYSFSVSK